MKVKVTLIIIKQDIKCQFEHDDFFTFLINENNSIPSCYISTKDEVETIKNLFECYTKVCFEWCNIELCDFRKVKLDECEVVYSIKLPLINNIEKLGKFISHNKYKTEDKFYERILARKRRIF